MIQLNSASQTFLYLEDGSMQYYSNFKMKIVIIYSGVAKYGIFLLLQINIWLKQCKYTTRNTSMLVLEGECIYDPPLLSY